jgi:hypothetical protein
MSEPIDFPGPAYRGECFDPIINRVREKFLQRSEFGLNKYGVGLDRTDLNRKEWLIHLQHELMDAVGYLQVLIELEG